MKHCSVSDCEKPAKNAGMCWGHYTSLRRHGNPLHTDKSTSVSRRFYNSFEKAGNDDCWNWTKNTLKSKLPYGRIYAFGKQMLAHRFSWEFHVGAVPDGLCVLHKCDNPKCVNPNHLYVGNYVDNANDRETRNRRKKIRGEEIGNSKIKEEQVKEVRASGLSCYALAKKYNVSPSLIHLVKTNRVWKHVEVAI